VLHGSPILIEMAGFPGAVHDDIVDSVTQALNYLREDGSVFGFIDYLKGLAAGVFMFPEENSSSPRDDNADKSARLKAAIAAHPKVVLPVVPACPACGSVCTSRIGRVSLRAVFAPVGHA
jgi:hypothetical protein